MTQLATALEKLRHLNSKPFNSAQYFEFLSSDLILRFQKSILEGDQYQIEASQTLTALEGEISNLNELFSENEAKVTEPILEKYETSEEQSSSKNTTSGEVDPVPLVEQVSASINETDLIKKCLQAVQILQKGYIPNLKALITSIKQSQENLSEIQDGLVIDTHKFEGYDLFLEIAILIDQESANENKIYNYHLFLINLLLAYVDDYLECNDSTISTLDGVISFLANDHKDSQIKSVLKEKAEFLKYKIQFRFSRPNSDNSVLRAIPNDLESNIFTPLCDKIKNHYQNNFPFPGLISKVVAFKSTDINSLELENFHHLNRYYSKFDELHLNDGQDGLKILEAKLSEFSKQDFSIYDSNALNSVEKLIKNSLLRIEFRKQEFEGYTLIIESFRKILVGSEDEAKIESQLTLMKERINSIRPAQKFPDYYCYILFVKFMNKMIDEFIRHPDKIITKDFFQTLLDNKQLLLQSSDEEVLNNVVSTIRRKLEILADHIKTIYTQSLKELQDDLRIMVTHKVKPITLRFAEYRVLIKWEGEEKESFLFLDSSYILPINHIYINQKVDSWSSLLVPQLNNLMYAFEMAINRITVNKNVDFFEKKAVSNTESFSKLVTEKTEALTTETKKNEFRTVSILAMFISVATFVLTNVKTFENKSPMESVGILFGIAACLLLFNLFFYISSVQQNDSLGIWEFFKKFWIAILLPIIFGITSLCILDKESTNNITTVERLQDSVAIGYKQLEEIRIKQMKIENDHNIQHIADSLKHQ